MISSRAGRRLRRLGALAIAALGTGLITGLLLGLLAGLLLAMGAPAAAQPVAPVGAFGWPLQPGPPAVLTPFRAPSHPYGPGHRGVDLAGLVGQPVLAAGDGVVAFADVLAGRGVVSVEHASGLRTTYEPLEPVEPGLRAGRPVRRGEPLGRLAAGHPTCAPAACLHWGLRRARAEGFEYLDPLRLVRYRVRLLPAAHKIDGAVVRPYRTKVPFVRWDVRWQEGATQPRALRSATAGAARRGPAAGRRATR